MILGSPNWQITNLPLALVLILDSAYFIFNIILFRKNIHLLLLYPRHVIKLSGHNLGCYIEDWLVSYIFRNSCGISIT